MSNEIWQYLQTSKKNVILIYLFYFCGLLYLSGVTVPIFSIAGVILAYINREGSDSFLSSHYDFLIRTFWVGIVALIIIKLLPIISSIVGVAFAIWYLCRNVLGFRYLLSDLPHPNPRTLSIT